LELDRLGIGKITVHACRQAAIEATVAIRRGDRAAAMEG
jgi:hypothetical protein